MEGKEKEEEEGNEFDWYFTKEDDYKPIETNSSSLCVLLASSSLLLSPLIDAIISGFQIFLHKGGPLCEEPYRGVCIVVEKMETKKEDESDVSFFINSFHEACEASIAREDVRLMEVNNMQTSEQTINDYV